ncbi:MAG: c-di-GMP-binding flagellar brake protein YcgR [Paraglaciecola sp.]|jgi:c-di-GMP-binding flagellar brake protein YcgR
MVGYDDKRKFFRMMVNSTCELVVNDDESSRSIQAVCKDISATGMSFEVEDESIELGTQVEVYIESISAQIPSLSASAKVVRCESDITNTCIVGVEITEMK